jgi:hypothetical protein
LQSDRFIIEGYLDMLHQILADSRHGEWKEVMSRDEWIIIYHSDAFTSDEQACHCAFSKNNAVEPLRYTDDEFKDEN